MHTKSLLAPVLLLALAAAAPRPAHAWWHSATVETSTFDDGSKIFHHQVSDRAVGTRLVLRFRVDSGEAVVRLIDPAGKTRFQQSFAPGKVAVDRDFVGARGDWQVRLHSKDASGSYTVRLVDF